jgi:hypothetical protein
VVLDTTLIGVYIILLAEQDNRIEQIKNKHPKSNDVL